MIGKTLPILALVLTVSTAGAQDIVRKDQLESLRTELGNVTSRVQDSIVQTSASMATLDDYQGSEQTAAAFALLDAIEAETRVILEQVRLNSPFMDALDDARANVVTILRKNEREPASDARDARIARLTKALSDLEDQYTKIQSVENTMTRLLADHAVLRRQIELDGEVDAVEAFVAELSTLTANLDEMTAVLEKVATSTIDVRDAGVVIDQN